MLVIIVHFVAMNHFCSLLKLNILSKLRVSNGSREGGNVGLNPSDLVCGGCSAAADGKGRCTKGHGKEYIEFKCRYCCSPASFFCFGRTHFCNSCHHTRPDNQEKYVPLKCKGPNWCPLRVSHLPNGQECCLGCSMCRFDGQ